MLSFFWVPGSRTRNWLILGSRHEAADSRLKLEQLLTEKIRELGMRAPISCYQCVGSDRISCQFHCPWLGDIVEIIPPIRNYEFSYGIGCGMKKFHALKIWAECTLWEAEGFSHAWKSLKVPSHQIRSAWKWYGWVGLDEYMDRGWCTDFLMSSLFFKI